MQQETLQKHTDDLYDIKTALIHKQTMIKSFRNKMFVNLEGDVLSGNFTLRFSQGERQQGTIEKAILDKLVDDYKLDVQNEIDCLTKCLDFLSAIGEKKDYCEVDIFDDEIKIVKC